MDIPDVYPEKLHLCIYNTLESDLRDTYALHFKKDIYFTSIVLQSN